MSMALIAWSFIRYLTVICMLHLGIAIAPAAAQSISPHNKYELSFDAELAPFWKPYRRAPAALLSNNSATEVFVPHDDAQVFGGATWETPDIKGVFTPDRSESLDRTCKLTTAEFPASIPVIEKSTRRSVCSGTLVGPQTILTAAHCALLHGAGTRKGVAAGV
ncbi:MAG: trypsin-like serine protease, partial [Gallionella sp.]